MINYVISPVYAPFRIVPYVAIVIQVVKDKAKT